MNFEASNKEELSQALDLMDITVPPRYSRRTTEHTEIWLIHKFIRTLQQCGQINPPICLINRERPDFELTINTTSLGIEITEIINPDYAKTLSLPEAQNETSIIDASLFKWGSPKRSLHSLREIASRKKLTGTPWMGNSVETEFVKSIIDTVNCKHQKYINGYEIFNLNCLLIYHNQSSPNLDFSESLNMTSEGLKSYWSDFGFDRIYIHKYDKLLEFRQHSKAIYQVVS